MIWILYMNGLAKTRVVVAPGVVCVIVASACVSCLGTCAAFRPSAEASHGYFFAVQSRLAKKRQAKQAPIGPSSIQHCAGLLLVVGPSLLDHARIVSWPATIGSIRKEEMRSVSFSKPCPFPVFRRTTSSELVNGSDDDPPRLAAVCKHARLDCDVIVH